MDGRTHTDRRGVMMVHDAGGHDTVTPAPGAAPPREVDVFVVEEVTLIEEADIVEILAAQ